MKMQKGSALGVENAERLLDQNTASAQVLDQVADRCEGAYIGVFHGEGM